MKKTYKKLLVAALFVTVIAGCKKDFFELEDPTGIDADIWGDAGALTCFFIRAMT
jgi:hypothetical protein